MEKYEQVISETCQAIHTLNRARMYGESVAKEHGGTFTALNSTISELKEWVHLYASESGETDEEAEEAEKMIELFDIDSIE